LEKRVPAKSLWADKPVLVAEDNPVMQELAVRRIRKMGLNAFAVGNGLEVLEALKKQEYALILMDCQMPDMDGFEATAAIRKEEAGAGKHTPIIAMTAAAMVGDREHCITAGMDDYLSKPVSPEQLTKMLQKWLPHKKQKRVLKERPVSDSAKSVTDAYTQGKTDGLIDMFQLESLYGKNDVSMLLDSFIIESNNLAESIVKLTQERDAHQLAMQVHQLKGLAAVMTAETLAARCLDLEGAVKVHSWDEVEALSTPVFAELAKIVRYCKELLLIAD
jgi:CheY-like chemotaxis protein/HPt (histidine-containing phosphotransfer) domain-containing protein